MFKSLLEMQIDSVARIEARNDAIDSRIAQVDQYRNASEKTAMYQLTNGMKFHKPEEKIAKFNLAIAKIGYAIYDIPNSQNKQEYTPLTEGFSETTKGIITGVIFGVGMYLGYEIQANQGIVQTFSQIWEKSSLPIFDMAIVGAVTAAIPYFGYVAIKSLAKGLPKIKRGYAKLTEKVNEQITEIKKQYSNADFPEISLI